LPYAKASFVLRASQIAHEVQLALRPPWRADAVASTTSHPAFVTTRDRPSCRNGMAGVRPLIWGFGKTEFCPSCQSVAARYNHDLFRARFSSNPPIGLVLVSRKGGELFGNPVRSRSRFCRKHSMRTEGAPEIYDFALALAMQNDVLGSVVCERRGASAREPLRDLSRNGIFASTLFSTVHPVMVRSRPERVQRAGRLSLKPRNDKIQRRSQTSALVPITDLGRTSREVRKVPRAEVPETSHATKKPPKGGSSIRTYDRDGSV
jgi:hypothetical protein